MIVPSLISISISVLRTMFKVHVVASRVVSLLVRLSGGKIIVVWILTLCLVRRSVP